MKLFSLYLTHLQLKILKDLSEATGTSKGELIRRAIDQYITQISYDCDKIQSQQNKKNLAGG